MRADAARGRAGARLATSSTRGQRAALNAMTSQLIDDDIKAAQSAATHEISTSAISALGPAGATTRPRAAFDGGQPFDGRLRSAFASYRVRPPPQPIEPSSRAALRGGIPTSVDGLVPLSCPWAVGFMPGGGARLRGRRRRRGGKSGRRPSRAFPSSSASSWVWGAARYARVEVIASKRVRAACNEVRGAGPRCRPKPHHDCPKKVWRFVRHSSVKGNGKRGRGIAAPRGPSWAGAFRSRFLGVELARPACGECGFGHRELGRCRA